MSVILLAAFVILTIGQLIFWHAIGTAIGFSAWLGLATLSFGFALICAVYVALMHESGKRAP